MALLYYATDDARELDGRTEKRTQLRLEELQEHGSYSNEIKFQYIPGWIELHFQDISDVVYHTSVAIYMFSTIYFGVFCGDGAVSSYS